MSNLTSQSDLAFERAPQLAAVTEYLSARERCNA
jgi:hypothetical protein